MQRRAEYVRALKPPGAGLYRARRRRGLVVDLPLLALLAIACAAGLLVLLSASGHEWGYVRRQAVFMALGFAAMLAVAQVEVRTLRRFAPLVYVAGLVLLALVPWFGVEAKGARRWLDLGPLRFQPAELLKIANPLVVAAFLAARPLPPRWWEVLAAAGLLAVPAVLVGLQPDLGTAILIFAAGFFALFLAGLEKRYLAAAGLLALAAAPLFWFYLLHDYQRTRILTLLDPQRDKLGAGWNIIQSTTAIGSGGWFGKGWQRGTQSQLDFLPESHTDFIVAVLAEEFGLVGVLALIALYLLLVLRGLAIALGARSTFARLLAGSLALTFFVYVFVNLGMVAGILPVVGVPLPFFSYGGTALLTLFVGFGILMAVAGERKES
ncbi:MAG: rod shape-determining protein RodA [Porticoccaceae bacterium]|nr:MAG: rod shape-determining protein RodA [Porticoccaceae bacterium]